MNKFALVSILINVAHVVSPTTTFIEGYYWRDYEGLIPADALRGGLDKSGRPTYIGQALFENKLLPGYIYENGRVVYFMWETEQSTDKNIRILCSQYPEKFQWIRTKLNEVMLLTDKLLVKGGYAEKYYIYIGRLYAGGETLVGRVVCEVTNCIALYLTKDGVGIRHTGAFEILAYNPNAKADGCNATTDLEVSNK